MVKILWVDDEIELLKPHILLLQSKGYEVDTCNNGYDAIDMAAEVAYDVIILDEMMPGMTGLETLPLIKDIRPTTPVIMVTKSEEEDIAIAKWCSKEELEENLRATYPTIQNVFATRKAIKNE